MQKGVRRVEATPLLGDLVAQFGQEGPSPLDALLGAVGLLGGEHATDLLKGEADAAHGDDDVELVERGLVVAAAPAGVARDRGK